MGRLGLLSCLGSIVFIAGCQATYLDVKPDGRGDYIHGPNGTGLEESIRIGVEYGLPMVQFTLSVTRTLVKCRDEHNQTDIRFSTKVAAEPRYVVGERFVIDYESLSSWSKVTGLDLQTYENGTLKSINASAEDQSAAIIGDVVKVGIGVASLVSGVPPVTKTLDSKSLEWRCSEQTENTLNIISSVKDALEKLTKELVQTTDTITRLESLAILNALTGEDKTKLTEAKTKQRELLKQAATKDKELVRLLSSVSVKEERIWPENGDSKRLNANPLPENAKFLKDLFKEFPVSKKHQVAGVGTAALKKDESGQPTKEEEKAKAEAAKAEAEAEAKAGAKEDVFLETLMASFQLHGELKPLVNIKPQENCLSCLVSGNNKRATGLYYQNPVPAHLVICRLVSNKGCVVSDDSPMVLNMQVMAPQLAPLRVLPLTNGMFQSNALSATFRENGGLATFKYEDKVARGKVLSETVAASMDSVLAYRDARQAHKASEKAAKKQEGLDQLDEEISRLEKQKKIAALNAELDGSTQDAAVETARVNARIAMLEAHRKLRELEGE